MRQRLSLFFLFVWVIGISSMNAVRGQEAVSGQPSGLINFQRDIAPILRSRCLECHGPKEAKNDFRVDEVEALMGFVEAGDVDASALWTDYLLTDDPDMRMPPKSQGELNPSELALIHLWIEEGAVWPSGAKVASDAVAEATVPVPAVPDSLLARVWAFQGYLHPATVHFPIALLLVGGAFVVVSWRYPILGQNVALVCLFLGTLSSIVATAMGWSFAVRRGYGGWDRFDMDSEIFWHRWSAVIVTVLAISTSAFALRWLQSRNRRTERTWKFGLLLLAMMVGAVGHQGGELTYGKTFYKEAFDVLFGTEAVAPADITKVAKQT